MNLLCNNSQRRRDLDSLCQAHLCLGSPVCLGVASARNIWNAIIVEGTNLVLTPLADTGTSDQESSGEEENVVSAVLGSS